jgi:hypothetical protein
MFMPTTDTRRSPAFNALGNAAVTFSDLAF